jgi:hypothetical protein
LLKVNLNAAVLKQDQRAYMIHPGKGYHLFAPFFGKGVIAPDLPELIIPDGKKPSKIKNIDAQIVRARALRDWLSLNSTEREKTEVSTKLTDYESTNTRRFHEAYKEHLTLILWQLPKGTVVFVPNVDLAGNGFFCELESRKAARVQFNGAREAKRFRYLGRPVKNIKSVSMRLIPPEILASKTRQSVVTKLDSYESERIFRLYYGSYSMIGGMTQVEVDIPTKLFRPADANVISGLANLMEDNLQKFERGEINATTFVDALFLAFDDAELQIHARLNSEGILQLAAKSISPMLFSVFIAISATHTPQQVVAEIRAHTVNVMNSKCPDDDQYPRLIEERLYGILDMMAENEIVEVCERTKDFLERTGASTDATLE